MKPLNELIILNHFYYCFLLAIKIRKYNLPSSDGKQGINFLKNWLSNAQKKKLFDKLVYDEIQWLKETIFDAGICCAEFEFNIELIYQRSTEMIQTEERKFSS